MFSSSFPPKVLGRPRIFNWFLFIIIIILIIIIIIFINTIITIIITIINIITIFLITIITFFTVSSTITPNTILGLPLSIIKAVLQYSAAIRTEQTRAEVR